MQTLTEIKELLASRGLSPRHRLGQNFLHDHNQLRKIVEAGEISAGDLVLEVDGERIPPGELGRGFGLGLVAYDGDGEVRRAGVHRGRGRDGEGSDRTETSDDDGRIIIRFR